jgi:hypothetical protein
MEDGLRNLCVVAALAFLCPGVLCGQTEHKLTASDGLSYDDFGVSTDIEDDTAVIGAFGADTTFGDEGAVYVFIRSDGVWSETAKLESADAAEDGFLGGSVALDLDTIVAGASGDDDGASGGGSVYVFVRSAGVWTEQAELTAADAGVGDNFGHAVAVDGDTLVVGAHYANNPGTDSGSAYVFTRSEGVWTQQAELFPSDGGSYDQFGQSVAVEGDTVLVGAPYASDGTGDTGAVYVFERSGTVWIESEKLTGSAVAWGADFGVSVALDGDVVVIGARDDDVVGTDSGSAFVFERGADGVWTESAKLVTTDASIYDRFGKSVAVNRNTIAVGASHDGDGGGGSVYVFTRAADGTWGEHAKLVPTDNTAQDQFGTGVSISRDDILSGAVYDDDNGTSSGSAYVFLDAWAPLLFADGFEDGTLGAWDAASAPGSKEKVPGTALRIYEGGQSSASACQAPLGTFTDGSTGLRDGQFFRKS